MSSGDVVTFHQAGVWHNRVDGEGVIGSYGTQQRAVAKGAEEARRRLVCHIVRTIDGVVVERTDYTASRMPA